MKKITVDFDGTLCLTAFPEVGRRLFIHKLVAKYVERKRRKGWIVILHTMRNNENGTLDPALKACDLWGLGIDYVNENYPPDIEKYGADPRKIGAQRNIDDSNVGLIGAILRKVDEVFN